MKHCLGQIFRHKAKVNQLNNTEVIRNTLSVQTGMVGML